MALKDNIVAWFAAEEGIDLSRDEMAMNRISDAAEKAENELRTSEETEINLPFITASDNGPLHLEVTVSRDWLSDTPPWDDGTVESQDQKEETPQLQQYPAGQKIVTTATVPKSTAEVFKKDTPLFSMKFILAFSALTALAITVYFLFFRNQ